jgi:hydroxymethylpyrimidine pyrophosphatase-like HAD family hydrolase
LIVKNGNFDTLIQHRIMIRSLEQIVDICKRYRVYTLAYLSKQELGLIGQSEYVLGWTRCSRRPRMEFNDMEIRWLEFGAPVTEEPTAVVIDTRGDKPSSRIIEHQLDSVRGITFTRGTKERHIEIRPASSNKGEALKYVASRFRLARNEVLALGDSENDVEMLQWAGIGVAVINAARTAIESSRYVSRYGPARSVVQVLRLVKSARRYLRERKIQTVITGYR